jgi:hypothetical protein
MGESFDFVRSLKENACPNLNITDTSHWNPEWTTL